MIQEKFVSLNSTQEFIEIETWLPLNNPLSHIKEHRCLKKVIHQIDRKWTIAPFIRFYCKILQHCEVKD